jgi:dienelactone hydrolase
MVTTTPITYVLTGGTFEGTLSWDASEPGPRPGVLVMPTFRGQSAFETAKAEALARLGHVAMAVDIYGQGRRGSTPEGADSLMQELTGNRPLLATRMNEVLAVLKNQPQVDATRMAAIGFCFGGKCVLDLARSGADVRCVVIFHGVYDPPPATSSAEWKAKVLICHGWEDPLATPAQTIALADELTARKADWQILAHGHTGHAFTNPNAANPAGGMFYQPDADRRSWDAMVRLLDEVLG